MSNLAFLQPFAQPDASKTKFPIPRLVTGQGSAGETTSESFCLAGQQMPGQWLLTECKYVAGWQQQKGFGLSGAVLLPVGDDLISVVFAIKIWTPADAAAYLALLKTILRKPAYAVPGSTKFAGMGIDQPQVVAMGVDTVVVKSATTLYNPLVSSGGKGAWTAQVEFLQYRQPVPAIPKPSQRIPDKAPPAPTAQTAVQVENQRLLAVQAAKAAEIKAKLGLGPKP